VAFGKSIIHTVSVRTLEILRRDAKTKNCGSIPTAAAVFLRDIVNPFAHRTGAKKKKPFP